MPALPLTQTKTPAKDAGTGTLLRSYVYGYDDAANRTTATEDGVALTAVVNGFNQATENDASGGVMLFRGTVSEPSAVTLAGVPATLTGLEWKVAAPVSAGANHLALMATETSGVPAGLNAQTTTRHLDFTLNANKGYDYGYDLNGNQTARAGRQTFEWDAADRLVAINYPGTTKRSEFTYDGLSRRVKVVEKAGTTVTSDRRYVWDGMAIAEERNASNAVTRRFFAEGEQVVGAANLFYERDHLGSVQAMRDATGTLRARYDYDPYGVRRKVSGDLEAAFGYTGHWQHAASGLPLAPYRAYDPEMGRWLSRDPIGEEGGMNLYGYVLNSPISLVDPTGEAPADWADGLDGYLNTAQDFYTTDRHWLWDGTVGTGSDLLRGIADVLRFGDGTGRAVYDPSLDCVGRGGAVVQDLLRGTSLVSGGGAAALRGGAWLGGTRAGHLLNHNRYLRLGPGRMPKLGTLPAGPKVPRLSVGPQRPGVNNPHRDLRVRPFDK